LSKAILVKAFDRTINPTKAQRFFDGIVVRDAGLVRVRLEVDELNFGL
jgi:hypothetical protein